MRLAKLRGTPGLKEDKISEAEREVTEAEQKVRKVHVCWRKVGFEGGEAG